MHTTTTMLPITLVVLALGAPAFAQEPAAGRQVASTRDLGPVPAAEPRAGGEDTVAPGETTKPLPYWGEGDARPFLSADVEASLLAARASLAAGYGRPHYRWLGVEVRSRVSNKGGTEYAGLRAETSSISLRAGGRYVFGLSQEFLLPDESYTQQELDDETAGQQHYFGIDAELTGAARLLGAKLMATVTGMMITGVPSDRYVFEDELKVVVEPPWVWRGRLAALVPVDAGERLEVGAAGEVIGVPERQMYVGRAGPVLEVAVTRHLDARATVLLVVAGRDRIGLAGADFAQLGLRYRWASGEPRPAFP